MDPSHKDKCRVLLIAQFGKIGGTRTYLDLLLQFLRELNAEIILVPDTKNFEEIEVLHQAYPEVKVVYPKTPLNAYPSGFPACIAKTFWKLRDSFQYYPFDLTIVSSSSGEAWIETLLFPWPAIYVVHTYPFWGRHTRRLGNFFWKLIARSLSKNVIVTVSQASKAIITKEWFACNDIGESIKVIYNPSRYCQSFLTSSDAHQFNYESFSVLTVGSLEKHKNPYFWVDVALTTKLIDPQVKIQFIWVGEGSLFAALQDYVKPYPWITLIGSSNCPEEYYQRASVYLQPSLVESQGMAVLEAASFGVPAIVSDVGGLPEIVKHGETGFVIPTTTPWSYAEQIVELWKNPEQCRQMGDRARSLQNSQFSVREWRDRMTSLIIQSIH